MMHGASSLPQAARAQAALLLPGAALAAVIGLAAAFVSSHNGGPRLLYALLFGVFFHHLSQEARTRPGLEFCARTVLRLAVGLLGARITLAQIASLGWQTAAVVVGGVASTIVLGLLLARRMRMGGAEGILSGGSVAICGASAALAISAVLPRSREGERFTLMVVVTVTVMSTVAMVLYPAVARALDLPPVLAGLFLGGTIHDVAQVLGAGYMLGQDTGDAATIVKLFRVSLLALVVLGTGAAIRWRARGAAVEPAGAGGVPRQALVPWFLWLFVALVVANSLGWLAEPVQSAAGELSAAALVMAIAALGTKTSFAELASAGWRPFLLILAETLWLAGLVLAYALWVR